MSFSTSQNGSSSEMLVRCPPMTTERFLIKSAFFPPETSRSPFTVASAKVISPPVDWSLPDQAEPRSDTAEPSLVHVPVGTEIRWVTPSDVELRTIFTPCGVGETGGRSAASPQAAPMVDRTTIEVDEGWANFCAPNNVGGKRAG